ncbi:hypothetical protein OS493_000747 [Desmophyllum pertusum]|uniref:Uncharacterized protein n=1 Tax=Desmophyllum pertusum TaxID=174260 RepID=A0A9X0A8G0_9CNID|nr:hypothetical protein OS493_000747 [Desmophyllum pertusum]
MIMASSMSNLLNDSSSSISLMENDIPGASFLGRKPEELKNTELRIWLKCHDDLGKGLKMKVYEYIRTGKDKNIVDSNPDKIYSRRKERASKSTDVGGQDSAVSDRWLGYFTRQYANIYDDREWLRKYKKVKESEELEHTLQNDCMVQTFHLTVAVNRHNPWNFPEFTFTISPLTSQATTISHLIMQQSCSLNSLKATSPVKLSNFQLKPNPRTKEEEIHVNKITKFSKPDESETDFDFKEIPPEENKPIQLTTVQDVNTLKANSPVKVNDRVTFLRIAETVYIKQEIILRKRHKFLSLKYMFQMTLLLLLLLLLLLRKCGSILNTNNYKTRKQLLQMRVIPSDWYHGKQTIRGFSKAEATALKE